MKKALQLRKLGRVLPVFFLLASVSAGFAQSQKKSATSTQEKPGTLLVSAMKNMESGVWSVNGIVTAKKTIKLHGLLAGEDFDDGYGTDLLFTLRFDDTGKWKIVKTHRMSEKEVEKGQKGQ